MALTRGGLIAKMDIIFVRDIKICLMLFINDIIIKNNNNYEKIMYHFGRIAMRGAGRRESLGRNW